MWYIYTTEILLSCKEKETEIYRQMAKTETIILAR